MKPIKTWQQFLFLYPAITFRENMGHNPYLQNDPFLWEDLTTGSALLLGKWSDVLVLYKPIEVPELLPELNYFTSLN